MHVHSPHDISMMCILSLEPDTAHGEEERGAGLVGAGVGGFGGFDASGFGAGGFEALDVVVVEWLGLEGVGWRVCCVVEALGLEGLLRGEIGTEGGGWWDM